MLADRWHNGYRSGVTVPDAPRVDVTCVVDPQGKEPAEASARIISSDGQWDATGHFRVEGGQVICTRLDVGAAPPGITSGFLRTVPMGTILTLVRSALAEQADLFDAAAKAVGPDSDFGQSTRAAATHLRPQNVRRGRPGLPDAHYQRIAHAYLALQAQGWSRGLLDELAHQEGRPRETIRDWVHTARKRRFLSTASRGRPGALPGPRLHEPPSDSAE
jgi:hypothetical protein